MAFDFSIRLDRLVLIPATKDLLQAEEDLAELAQALQARVPKNWPMPMYDAEARRFFLSVVSENPKAVGWTAWYVLLPDESGNLTLVGSVGACGLPNDDGEIIVGYSMLDQYQHRGYATEALRGFLDWARQHPDLKKAIAETFPNLPASIRVLEKSGFVQNGEGSETGSIRFEFRLK